MAPRVAKLICVDASPGAAAVAEEKLRPFNNCEVHVCTLEDSPVADNSLDFAYCLGVLHYVPDPQSALTAIARKLKPGRLSYSMFTMLLTIDRFGFAPYGAL